jgi:hypothetical protein
MPRKEINYSNTIIYKLVCNNPTITDIYVGHTTDFIRRKQCHKYSCNNENHKSYNFYVYQYIRNNGGWDNWSMIEIEKYSCEDRQQAEARERHWLETLRATLNMVVPTRTKNEYREANKQQINEYHREYYEANREIINEKLREHYQKNKDRINEKKKEKITCECGVKVPRRHLSEHRKTKKHLKFFE